MATIDVDELRSYLLDYCGSAMMSGFPSAILEIVDVECAAGEELCVIANRLGIDLSAFTID